MNIKIEIIHKKNSSPQSITVYNPNELCRRIPTPTSWQTTKAINTGLESKRKSINKIKIWTRHAAHTPCRLAGWEQKRSAATPIQTLSPSSSAATCEFRHSYFRPVGLFPTGQLYQVTSEGLEEVGNGGEFCISRFNCTRGMNGHVVCPALQVNIEISRNLQCTGCYRINETQDSGRDTECYGLNKFT